MEAACAWDAASSWQPWAQQHDPIESIELDVAWEGLVLRTHGGSRRSDADLADGLQAGGGSGKGGSGGLPDEGGGDDVGDQDAGRSVDGGR